MELKSKIFKCVSSFKGNSKFEFWNMIEIGDEIQISMILKHTGYGHSGIYVPKIKIENLTKNNSFSDTMNNFQNYLKKIAYEEKGSPEPFMV